MGDLDDVKDIVETKNIDVNNLGQEYRPALTVASIEGQIEIAKYLIQKGADVNVLDEDNLTPLHHAVEVGHSDIIKLLIEHGADLDIKGSTDEWTALHEASQHTRLDILQLLVKNSAKFSREKWYVMSSHRDIYESHDVKFLVECGIDVNATYGDDGETALILATGLAHFDIVRSWSLE